MPTSAHLKTRLYRRLEDPAKTHWSEDEINDLINDARTELWQFAKSKNQSVIPLTGTRFTWEANDLSVSLASELSSTNFDIYLVSMTATVASIDSNNPPVPLPRIPYEEVHRSGLVKPLYHGNYHTGDSSSSDSNTWSPGGNARIYAWAMQGQNLYLSPVPTTDVQIYVEYMKPFADLTLGSGGDTEEIFATADAAFRPWESIIELSTVLAAKGRSDEASDPVMRQWQYKMELFTRWLEAREITGTPRVMLNGY